MKNLSHSYQSSSRLFSSHFIFVSYIVLSTIGMVTTTHLSRLWIENARVIGIGLFLVSSVYYLCQIKSSSLSKILIILLSVMYLFIAIFLYSMHHSNIQVNLINILVILSGLFSFIVIKDNNSQDSLVNSLIIYFLAAFFITYITGGFEFGIPPKFNLSHLSEPGRVESYSLGVSHFFGLAAVLAAYRLFYEKKYSIIFLYFILWIIFIILSLLGGGRGEAMTVIFFSILLIFSRYKFIFLISALVIVLLAIVFNELIATFLDKLVLYQRFADVPSSGLSGRGELYFLGLKLFNNHPECLLFGCGFDFFQFTYHFEDGKHTHNFILEMFIVLGIPLTILIALLSAIGLYNEYIKYKKINLVMIIFLFNTAIGLKSLSLLTNWLMMSGLIYYCVCVFYRREVHYSQRGI